MRRAIESHSATIFIDTRCDRDAKLEIESDQSQIDVENNGSAMLRSRLATTQNGANEPTL
jgi:hypothetical protein